MTSPWTGDPAAPSSRLYAVPDDLEARLRDRGFHLGDWRIEPRRQRIVSDEAERRLDPKLIDLLVVLASRPDDVHTRDELLERVWNDALVTENSLSQAVSRLRRALGDDASNPRYIETIAKSGYRLVADVVVGNEASADALPATPVSDASVPSGSNTKWLTLAAAALALLAMTVTIGLSVRGSTSAREATSSTWSTRPDVALLGQTFGPRLSPNGEYVAFAWKGPEQEGSWDIWLQAVGSGNPVRLTDHGHDERLATWSADGQSIAFVRFSETTEECGIFRVPLIGGPAVRMADCLVGMRSMAWAPDGASLFVNGVPDGAAKRSIHRLDLASGEFSQLTKPDENSLGDGSLEVSPDGQWLAFERDFAPFRHVVMLLPVVGGEPKALTDDRWGQLRGLDWTADSTAVIFSSNRTGQYLLWKVPIEGGDAERVAIQDAWVTQPSVARTGDRLIYRTFRDSVDVWDLPLNAEGRVDGEPQRRVPSSRSERQPAWSPSGDRLAFLSDRSGSLELWSASRSGSELIRHTDYSGPRPGSPTWSPDGRHIAFHAAVDGHTDIWLVDRAGQQVRRLTDDIAEDRNPVFTRDGSAIDFASNRAGTWGIWRAPLDGGAAESRAMADGFLAFDTGDSSYYARLSEPGIWKAPHSGHAPELLLGDLSLMDWGSWTISERALYYVTRGPTTIRRLDLASGEDSALYTPAKQIPYLSRPLSLSTDGRSLLFAMIDHSDDEIMLAEPVDLP